MIPARQVDVAIAAGPVDATSVDWFGMARILVVEDDAAVQRLLAKVLRTAGFKNVMCFSAAEEALESCAATPPDLVLVDLHLPRASGFELLEWFRGDAPPGEFLPVIMLTGDASPTTRRRALNLGAHDFLTKPFDKVEVLLRIRNLLRTRHLNLSLKDSNSVLEARVLDRTANLEEARHEALEHLARAAEFRDDVTGQHTHRVGVLSAGIARALGWETPAVALILHAAPLHDIGKIGVPDSILLKAGSLTPEEFDTMKRHTTIGGAILAGSRTPVFVLAREIVLSHHERWDGTGYPNGLAGETIPVSGRIVCVADVYDALTNVRPYKGAMSAADALAEIVANSGTHFDPAAVAAFLRYLGRDPAAAGA